MKVSEEFESTPQHETTNKSKNSLKLWMHKLHLLYPCLLNQIISPFYNLSGVLVGLNSRIHSALVPSCTLHLSFYHWTQFLDRCPVDLEKDLELEEHVRMVAIEDRRSLPEGTRTSGVTAEFLCYRSHIGISCCGPVHVHRQTNKHSPPNGGQR